MKYLAIGCLAAAALAAAPTEASAQTAGPQVSVEALECVPMGRHSIVEADVASTVPGNTVRLYFRRLNQEVEDFYWIEMEPFEGRWWAPMPQPEDHGFPRHALNGSSDARRELQESEYRWAAWWKAKELSDHRDPNGDLDTELIAERAQVGSREPREWMRAIEEQNLEQWLDRQINEGVEYYVAVLDSYGRMVPGGRSEMQVAPVVDVQDCPQVRPETEREQGAALNMTIGETALWQSEERLYHWTCHGVVTRVDAAGVPRADERCRACVVGFLPETALVVPVLAGAGVTIFEPPNPSPTSPGPR
jgi:hypothetical protein